MKLAVLDTGDIDLATGAAGLQKEDSLFTAVIVSLLTDRRAEPDDRLPDDMRRASAIGPDRRGWCGDMLAERTGDRIGSRLWLLAREKQTEETRRRAIAYCKEALQWLIEDGLAAAITVGAEWATMGRLDAVIDIALVEGGTFSLQLADLTGDIHAV